uniref:VWFA domain-containing protein n=1 Tax=Plectus sambesii TaxID=2011161 RepID=A0A914XMI6_9BILA
MEWAKRTSIWLKGLYINGEDRFASHLRDLMTRSIVDYAVYATSHGLLVENHYDHEELSHLINDVKFRGYDNRNIYYALLQGSLNLNANTGLRGAEVQKIGMIFSAAAFTGGSATSSQAIFKSYTDAGFVFYGFGVGPNANNNELVTLIGQSNNVFPFINEERLKFVVGWLHDKVCNPSSTYPAR